MAEKEEKIEFEGEVSEALGNGKFRIALDNGHETIGYTAGKMRRMGNTIQLVSANTNGAIGLAERNDNWMPQN